MSQKILLVDDESALLYTYSRLLKTRNIHIDTAASLEEANQLLTENVYRFIIVDIRLTGTDATEGFEILHRVKTHNPKTNVIVITAYGSQQLMERSYEMGASFYFEKPFPVGALRDAMRHLAPEFDFEDASQS